MDAPKIPLVVDMDGTLLRTDVLCEGLALAFATRPLQALLALPLIVFGRPRFKARIAEIAPLDLDTLPLREDLVAWLREEAARGRELHLFTAAAQAAAEQVAARVGLFASVEGSRSVNLKGRNKLAAIQARFPDGFAYAGDSHADLQIWKASRGIVFAGHKPEVEAAARKLGVPVEATFPQKRAGFDAWRRVLRNKWWWLALATGGAALGPTQVGQPWEPDVARGALFAFATIMAISGLSLLHEILRTHTERKAPSGRDAPFATGEIPLGHGLILAPLALVGATIILLSSGGIALMLMFLLAYLLATLGRLL